LWEWKNKHLEKRRNGEGSRQITSSDGTGLLTTKMQRARGEGMAEWRATEKPNRMEPGRIKQRIVDGARRAERFSHLAEETAGLDRIGRALNRFWIPQTWSCGVKLTMITPIGNAVMLDR
jgi:hypothetical protein